MQVSLEWLNEYVDIKGISVEQIAHELTMSGLEVEEVEKIEAKFSNIVVAEIKELKPHPNADKLRLVTIFNGKENCEVVCGAQNIEVGQIIPYASIGSEVLDRKSGEKFKLKPIKIRDVESQGMLCSSDELGVEELELQKEDGILILNRIFDDLTPGQNVEEVLNLKKDYVLHIAPTANRGDEMSIVGVSREVATFLDRPLNFSFIECTQNNDCDFKVEIKDNDTCKYYAIGVLKDIQIKKSPDWMIRRLLASGVRSINNVVDITNYVMLEYGQPLHAFDLDKLEEKYLCVRRAEENEEITTLDEIQRKMNKESVVIATSKKSVALAGLMGGFTSEVDENSKNLALESAYFVPVTTRKSARSVGHRTEASARFERGVDIEAVKPALIRAIQLLVEHAGAKFEGISETGENKLPDVKITLRFNQIKRILGIEIPADKCVSILQSLGFDLIGKNEIAAMFKVPSFRVNDVTREIDLIEEISRIHGYDKIEPTLPNKTCVPEISQETINLNKINDLFLGQGFYEIITSSLIGKPLYKWIGMDYESEKAVEVSNPQSEEHTMLRQSLIPNLINVIKHNFDKGQKDLWVYEIGRTYFANSEPDLKNSGVDEKRYIAGAITGNILKSKWTQNREVDFYTLKGVIESLFKALGLENRIQYQVIENLPYLHPGRAAEAVLLGKKPLSIAKFGQLHPLKQEKCKLGQIVYVFEIDLESILENIPKSTPRYKSLPQYPSVTRDIAFIVPQDADNQDITKAIKKSSSNLLKELKYLMYIKVSTFKKAAKV